MKIGANVKGVYNDHFPFTGKVIAARPIYVKTDGCIQHTIQLDKEINIYGTDRSIILCHTLPNGKPSSYVDFSDAMEEY